MDYGGTYSEGILFPRTPSKKLSNTKVEKEFQICG